MAPNCLDNRALLVVLVPLFRHLTSQLLARSAEVPV